MSVVCLGLNHHTAPVQVRERFAVSREKHVSVLRRLREISGVEEAVALSTCNRVEFYLGGKNLDARSAEFDRFLSAHGSREGLEKIYRFDTERSVEHLFRVVCGLDSMILGETEVLGQVKQAYLSASAGGFTGKRLHRLFQRAFQAAKEVRTDTDINRGAVSISSVAADLAEKVFGNLSDSRVMIFGVGETGERTARSFLNRGARRLYVCNRSLDKAERLAENLGGKAVAFSEWKAHLPELDILITCMNAPSAILSAKELQTHQPLFLIDLAVPRNVSREVREMENVHLYDIDSLEALAEHSRVARATEIAECERILSRHRNDFLDWLNEEFPGSLVC